MASRNPKAYMELLFWKSTKQATEMVDGYDAEPQAKKSKSAWSDEEEDELRTLFMEHQTNKPSQGELLVPIFFYPRVYGRRVYNVARE